MAPRLATFKDMTDLTITIDAVMGLCQRAVDTLAIHKNTIDL
jgi:hypothetical protein